MIPVKERQRYESDMGIALSGVPVLISGAIATALAGGFALSLLFSLEYYFVVILPSIVAFGIGTILYFLVGYVKCRNYWLVGVLSLTAAFLAYGSYFYFDMQEHGGPPFQNRIDRLPDYILDRMQTDVHERLFTMPIQKRNPVPNGQARPDMNWFTAALELVCLTLFVPLVAFQIARRAFSHELDRWATRETFQSSPYSSERLLRAWTNDSLPQAMGDIQPISNRLQRFMLSINNTTLRYDYRPGATQGRCCTVLLEWFDTPEKSPLEFPIYASIEDHWNVWGLRFLRFTVIRQVVLSVREVLSLLRFFPKLALRLEDLHPELYDGLVSDCN